MTNIFYRNVQLLLLTLLLIFVWGASAFLTLPRLEDPELTQRNARIVTIFPGATAERVETLVTDRLEEELFEIEEIKHLDTTSRFGISTVVVELEDTVKEVDQVWSRVRDKVDDAVPLLPAETLAPEFEDVEVSANAMILGLTWELDAPANYSILGRLAEELEDIMRGIGGTEKINIAGSPAEEIVVEIDQTQLASLGLEARSLSQLIAQSDAKVSAGQLRSNNNDLLFEVTDELDSPDRIRRIPIRTSNGDFSNIKQLGDIATVNKGIIEPATELALINGHPGITLAIRVSSDFRLDQWTQTAEQKISEFRNRLPTGIGLNVVFEQNRYVTDRLNGVIANLLMSMFLVVLITLFIMGWRSALIVGTALPLSILMVFGSMSLLGVPLHQMSVTGLIIALGLLIDNAIIMVDEVQSEIRKGHSPGEAVSQSVKYLAVPLLGSTITTVLAFLPIPLSPGSVGEFTGAIGISVILSLISSLFLALTVVAALAGRINTIGNPNRRIRNRFSFLSEGFSNQRLTNAYRWTLRKILSRPVLGIALALILPIAGFAQAATLDQQFFPPTDREQFHIELESQAQTSIAETKALALQARKLIIAHPDVVDVSWFMGGSAPEFYYNVISDRRNSANYAQGIVQIKAGVKPRPVIQQLQQELDNAFPGTQILVRQLEQGPPFDAPVELRVYGPDLDQLRDLGNQLRAILAEIPNVLHTRASLTDTQPKLGLVVDEEKARLSGLDRQTIAQQLDASLEGASGGSVLEGTEELPVRVRVANRDRANLSQIASLDLVPSHSNGAVPLESVADLKLIPDLAAIIRRDGRRVNAVKAYITAGVLPSQVLNQFKQQLVDRNFELPPGYSYEFAGEAEARDNAIGNLASTVGVLTVLMIATLVLSLGSFQLAGVIGAIAFLAIGLALMALATFGQPFGFMAILGALGLVGLAINDSIVVLVAIKTDPLASKGDRKAIAAVVVNSTRHVIATTITTIIGFIPLLLDPTGFWPPLAIGIAGGLGGATLLALYFVPSVYALLSGQYRQKNLPKFSRPLNQQMSS